MKSRYCKSATIVAALGAVGWMVWHWLDSVSNSFPAVPAPAPVPVPVPQDRVSQRPQGTRMTSDEIRKVEEDENRPVVFYGEVMDQDGAPLSNVSISYQITRARVSAMQDIARLNTSTDASGKFTIKGMTGSVLGIGKLAKEGYHPLFHGGNNYSYGSASDIHRPDESKPVQFTLAPTGAGEDVLEWDVDLAFKWNDPPKRYDLATGKASDSGDLEIVPRRKRFSEQNIRDFDWCFDLNVRGGGLIVVDPRKGPVAPRGGYMESISLGRGYADRPNLMGVTSASMCVRNAQGQYGLLKLTVYPDRRETSKYAGSMAGSWNPTGSRVVEKERPLREERGQ